MKQRDPHKLVSGIVKVASLPTIFVKIEEAIGSVSCSNKMLTDIVSEDTALAAKILRVANSAMYNFPSKIATVSQSITIIGTRQLSDLVLACSVVTMFQDIPENLVSMEGFWRHSISCGVAARVIAGRKRDVNVETAFVSGLLHDIGRLVMYKDMSADMAIAIDQARSSGELLYKVEKSLFGFDHAKIGGLLLKEWRLPPRLVESLAKHHNPTASHTYPAEAAMVHVADIIANSLRLGSSGEVLIPEFDHAAWDNLGLSPNCLSSLLDDIEHQYASAVEFILGNAA